MNGAGTESPWLPDGPRDFRTTHWSVVLAAGEGSSSRAAEALAQLCRAYWYPLYAFIRRQGHNPESAQDLTQEFFARLLEKGFLASASQDKGRFRSFLLTALKRFLVNEWERGQAQKRGGGQAPIPLDLGDAEARYHLEPVEERTAERIFEERWALALLDGAMQALQREFAADGRADLFEALKRFLYGERKDGSQADIGARFGMTANAVKQAVHRLRFQYRERLREAVAHTVASPSEIDDELRHLLRVLSG